MTKQAPLSPEKYIKTKARSLPLHQCYVNASWKSSQLAYVIVSRVHPKGTITLAGYLVDLLCLGVKDTFYKFNIPASEVGEILDLFFSQDPFVEIDYATAHNIVYAGLEFAQQYGIEPEKDFTITRFMLEEDDERIELIDIPCGNEEGKPFFLTSHDHPLNTRIIPLLEKFAGAGNYEVIYEDELDGLSQPGLL